MNIAKSTNFPDKTHLLWGATVANNFKISETFNDISNALQNVTFTDRRVFEIAGEVQPNPPLVKGMGTARLGKGRVKDVVSILCFSD